MKKLNLIFALTLLFFASIAFAQPGTLDSTFGVYGKFKLSLGGVYDKGYAVTLQPDGKVVVAGSYNNGNEADFLVARLLENGSLDPDFGGGDGYSTLKFGTKNEEAYAVALQSDGKIVLAGYTSNNLNKDFAIARFLPNGAIDSSFSSDGKQTVTFNAADDIAYAVAVQPDGKILVGGTAQNIGTTTDFALARYNENGTLDVSFSGDGKLLTDFVLRMDEIRKLLIQPDGKILAVGTVITEAGIDMGAARYNSDGTLDATFGTNGKANHGFGAGSDNAETAALLPDGKFLAAGLGEYTNNILHFAVGRYNPDGSVDSTFGNNGVAWAGASSIGEEAHAMVVQSDGKIVLAGHASINNNDEVRLFRFRENGTLDPGFGSGGGVVTSFSAGDDSALGAVVQPDDKIVICGLSFSAGKGTIAMARYLNGPEVGVLDLSNSVTQAFIYPNPVYTTFHLSFTLEKDETLSTALVDMQGRVLREYAQGVKFPAGKHELSYELPETLSPGAYALRIAGANGGATIQIVK